MIRRHLLLVSVALSLTVIAGSSVADDHAMGAATLHGSWVIQLDDVPEHRDARVELTVGPGGGFMLVSTPWPETGFRTWAGRWAFEDGAIVLTAHGSDEPLAPSTWLPPAYVAVHRSPGEALAEPWAWLDSARMHATALRRDWVLHDAETSSREELTEWQAPVLRLEPVAAPPMGDVLGSWTSLLNAGDGSLRQTLRLDADGRATSVVAVEGSEPRRTEGTWRISDGALSIQLKGAPERSFPLSITYLPDASGGQTLLARPGSPPQILAWQAEADGPPLSERLSGTWLWVLERWRGRQGSRRLGGLLLHLDPAGHFVWLWGHQGGVDHLEGAWTVADGTLKLEVEESKLEMRRNKADSVELPIRFAGRDRVTMRTSAARRRALSMVRGAHPPQLCGQWKSAAEAPPPEVRFSADGTFTGTAVRRKEAVPCAGRWAVYGDLIYLVDADAHMLFGASFSLSKQDGEDVLRLLVYDRDEVELTRSDEAPSLIGAWQSDTYTSQLGPTVLSCTFDNDGQFTMTVRLMMIPERPLETSGTYRLEGNRLMLEGRKSTVYEVAWEGDVLVLTEPNGDTYRLSRVEDE